VAVMRYGDLPKVAARVFLHRFWLFASYLYRVIRVTYCTIVNGFFLNAIESTCAVAALGQVILRFSPIRQIGWTH